METIDWLIIVTYLLGVIALGLWVGRNEKDLNDYFLGGRDTPWWAAGLSLVATEISAATFLGAPEQGYTRNLTYLQFAIGSLLARIALAFMFIGIFYKLRVVTVYGFLSSRFGYPTKASAAGAFLLGRLFAGGSRLFIAALAVKVITGYDMSVSIILLGIIAIVYTLFGGIKAVIWTDVMQAIVLIMGACFSIYYLYWETPLNFSEIYQFLLDHDKLVLFGTGSGGHRTPAIFSNAYHFIPAILGGFFLTMATHGTDQTIIQRLLTCRNSTGGKLSMVASGFFGIGVTILFMVVGLLLFVYVEQGSSNPALLKIAAELQASGQNGNFYLHYILMGLPAGVSGLIIAAVIAAAMSSIDSDLNAMSAAFVSDFYKPLVQAEGADAHFLKIARLCTLVFGFLLMGLAILVADFYSSNPETDLLSIALGVMTLFYGALLGVFLVGLFTKGRGSSRSNILAMLLSTLLIVFITYKQKLIPALGLYDPASQAVGFMASFFHFKLAWPWFIVIGTAVTFVISLIGVSAHKVVLTHRQDLYDEC